MRFESTSASLGAYVYDVDLTNLSDSEWQDVHSAFLEYGVLIFPEANINTSQQITFSERFGKIEILTGNPLIKSLYVCNVDTKGNVLPLDDDNFRIIRGNEYWHTDSSYMPVSAKASCISALTIPDGGGETCWADMRLAYDELEIELKQKVSILSAYHSFFYSQNVLGQKVEVGSRYGFHDKGCPLRPLVKIHPETDRKALYIGRHAFRIPDLDDSDAQELLEHLQNHACHEARVFEHTWSVGDVAIWDNRCVMHRVRPYDYTKPRIMRHTRIAGDPATESAPLHPDQFAIKFVEHKTPVSEIYRDLKD